MAYSQEWYTPTWLLTRIEKFLGGIELDPCSNPQKTVPAQRHYVGGHGDDGLVLPWDAKTMFLNPPWQAIDPWVHRLVDEYRGAAVLLVPDRTERPWFQKLLQHKVPVLLPKERIHYCKWVDDGEGNGSLVEKRQMNRGSNLFYWAPGRNPAEFRAEFEDLGCILHA